MKTLLKLLLLFFLSYGASAQVSFPKCNDFLPKPEPQSFTVPTPQGSTTATAFLAEYKPGRNKTLDGCIIILKAGTVIEIDNPLCLEKVTILAEEGSGIRTQSGQTLTLYNCTLEPMGANVLWNGITHEDEISDVEMHNCRLSNIAKAVASVPGL
jgi:hypothetical protein